MSENVYGPPLPPSLLQSTSGINNATIIGPVLPPHLAAIVAARDREREEEEEEALIIGPRPSGYVVSAAEAAAAEIEARSNRMKKKLLGQNETDDAGEVQRDTWMIDLPPELVPDFGVTARKFRTKAPTTERGADRSSWTDTPADKLRREQDAMEGKQPVVKKPNLVDYAQMKKDQEYAELVAEYNKSARTKSLMDLHTDKLHNEPAEKSKDKSKKKKKHKEKDRHRDEEEEDKHKRRRKEKKKEKREKEKEKEKDAKRKKSNEVKKEKTVVVERKPFDRELDLKSNRMDAAARKSLIAKSQQLGGRFGHGSAQFL